MRGHAGGLTEADVPKGTGRVHLIQHHLLSVLRFARNEVLKCGLIRADEHNVR